MSHVSYASRKFDTCEEMVSILHAVCVVSGHMEKLGREHVEIKIFGQEETYGYLLQECKDLLGKFGQVYYKMLCGGKRIVHLSNCLAFQNEKGIIL
jgi:hypothetical protein